MWARPILNSLPQWSYTLETSTPLHTFKPITNNLYGFIS